MQVQQIPNQYNLSPFWQQVWKDSEKIRIRLGASTIQEANEILDKKILEYELQEQTFEINDIFTEEQKQNEKILPM